MLDVRPLQASDWPALTDVLGQSFNAPAAGWDLFRDRVGDEALLVAWEGDRVVGGCGIYQMGQWWHGRSVPLAGLAGVGVLPDARGRGVARTMMERALWWAHARGIPVAGLYPAAQRVYRGVGYEQAGERVRYALPLDALAGFRQERPVVPIEPLDVRAQAELARRYRPVHGNLDRSPAIWTRLCQPWVGRRYAWLIGDDGFVVLNHHPPEGPHYDLEVVDLQAPDVATARTLLGLLAGHRSLAVTLRWFGAPADPLIALLPEPRWSAGELQRWMLRIVDVRAALEQRGWPASARGELHLRVDDPLLPHNTGDWILRVADGRAEVASGGRGELRTGPRGLAPLYSGLFGGTTLAGLGFVEGPPSALAMADTLFAGPTPWMREMY
jgi:predicted acetyltransferase